MQTSEQIDKIAPALLKAQAAIGKAVKGTANPFFKSKYADFGTVIEAVKSALNENEIFFIQAPSGDGQLVSVETRLVHSSGQWFASTATTALAKNDAQGVGSAITYLKRYGLQAMCGVPSEDDDGNAATGNAPKNDGKPPAAVLTPAAIADAKKKLDAAHAAGNMKDSFFELSPAMQEATRDYANGLRGIKKAA